MKGAYSLGDKCIQPCLLWVSTGAHTKRTGKTGSFPYFLLLSDVNGLDSFLLLPRKLRPAYTLFDQCEWVARRRSQDTQGTGKGPTCRSGLVSTSPPTRSLGTDLTSSKILTPMWWMEPCCHWMGENFIKWGLNEFFLRLIIRIPCLFFLSFPRCSSDVGEKRSSISIGRATAERREIQAFPRIISSFACLLICFWATMGCHWCR